MVVNSNKEAMNTDKAEIIMIQYVLQTIAHGIKTPIHIKTWRYFGAAGLSCAICAAIRGRLLVKEVDERNYIQKNANRSSLD